MYKQSVIPVHLTRQNNIVYTSGTPTEEAFLYHVAVTSFILQQANLASALKMANVLQTIFGILFDQLQFPFVYVGATVPGL